MIELAKAPMKEKRIISFETEGKVFPCMSITTESSRKLLLESVPDQQYSDEIHGKSDANIPLCQSITKPKGILDVHISDCRQGNTPVFRLNDAMIQGFQIADTPRRGHRHSKLPEFFTVDNKALLDGI